MEMKSLMKMTWMEAKLFLREPVGAFFTLVLPLMMLFIFASIYNSKPIPDIGGLGSISNYLPVLTAMMIGTSGLMSTTITM
jgi:ABC-2 type transport system permease protein